MTYNRQEFQRIKDKPRFNPAKERSQLYNAKNHNSSPNKKRFSNIKVPERNSTPPDYPIPEKKGMGKK